MEQHRPASQSAKSRDLPAAHAISAAAGADLSSRGKITIETRADGEWVEIRISDMGTGIPQDVVDRIFDPFFTTKEVGKGSGQDLAIARRWPLSITAARSWLRRIREAGRPSYSGCRGAVTKATPKPAAA